MIPGASFEVVKDAGHIPCAEQPAAIIKIVRGMMETLRQHHPDLYLPTVKPDLSGLARGG